MRNQIFGAVLLTLTFAGCGAIESKKTNLMAAILGGGGSLEQKVDGLRLANSAVLRKTDRGYVMDVATLSLLGCGSIARGKFFDISYSAPEIGFPDCSGLGIVGGRVSVAGSFAGYTVLLLDVSGVDESRGELIELRGVFLVGDDRVAARELAILIYEYLHGRGGADRAALDGVGISGVF